MKAIIAVNNLGYIGKRGGLPWGKCKADFKHFKEMTMGATLLVGWRTFQTLPPLTGREILLDERNLHYNRAHPDKQVDWCIGGSKTYEKYCIHFTELHISHILDNTIGDTVFPDLSLMKPTCKVFNYWFEVDPPTPGVESIIRVK